MSKNTHKEPKNKASACDITGLYPTTFDPDCGFFLTKMTNSTILLSLLPLIGLFNFVRVIFVLFGTAMSGISTYPV